MSKKQLIKKFNNGELKPIGVTHITNTSGIAVCHIEYGIDDKVFGYVTINDEKKYFYVKLHNLQTKSVFRIGNMTIDISLFS